MSLLLRFLGAPPAEPDFITWVEAQLEQDLPEPEGFTLQTTPEEDASIDQALDEYQDQPLADAEVAYLFIPEDDLILVLLDEGSENIEFGDSFIDGGPIEDVAAPADDLFDNLEGIDTSEIPEGIGHIEPDLVEHPFVLIPSMVSVRPRWLSKTKFVFYVERR